MIPTFSHAMVTDYHLSMNYKKDKSFNSSKTVNLLLKKVHYVEMKYEDTDKAHINKMLKFD